MGNSRQDYGDCGAASLGNSCYKTQCAGARNLRRQVGGESNALHAHLTDTRARHAHMCVSGEGEEENEESSDPTITFFI